jgi:hypothetical protein
MCGASASWEYGRLGSSNGIGILLLGYETMIAITPQVQRAAGRISSLIKPWARARATPRRPEIVGMERLVRPAPQVNGCAPEALQQR